jgi:hypothetical protein
MKNVFSVAWRHSFGSKRGLGAYVRTLWDALDWFDMTYVKEAVGVVVLMIAIWALGILMFIAL